MVVLSQQRRSAHWHIFWRKCEINRPFVYIEKRCLSSAHENGGKCCHHSLDGCLHPTAHVLFNDSKVDDCDVNYLLLLLLLWGLHFPSIFPFNDLKTFSPLSLSLIGEHTTERMWRKLHLFLCTLLLKSYFKFPTENSLPSVLLSPALNTANTIFHMARPTHIDTCKESDS